jgi:hypothetical protein
MRLVYQGDWNELPDFGTMTPTSSGVATKVELGQERFPEYTGLRLEGTVEVPASRVYRFALNSDDGARLWIDGELVVDNDGLHGPTTKIGAIALAKGAHHLRIDYFNKTGGAALSLSMATSGQSFLEVSPSILRHD